MKGLITKEQKAEILERWKNHTIPGVKDFDPVKELEKRIRAANKDDKNAFHCDRAKRIQKAYVALKQLSPADLKAAKKRLKEFIKSYGEDKTWYPYLSKMPGDINGMDFTIVIAAMQWL